VSLNINVCLLGLKTEIKASFSLSLAMNTHKLYILRYAQNRKIGKQNNLNILGSNTYEPTHGIQIWLRSPMPEGGDA